MANKPTDSHKSPLAFVTNFAAKTPFEELIDEWILASKANGRSEKTLLDYERIVLKFYWWWQTHTHYAEKLGDHPENVTKREAREFAAYLRQPVAFRWGNTDNSNNKRRENLSAASIASYGRTVKVFFNWLEQEGYIEKSPFGNKAVKFGSKKQDRVIKSITTHEIKKIYTVLLDKNRLKTFQGRRDLAIISLLFDSGIRRGELLSMKISDLDIEKRRAFVTGKVGRREVPFGEECKLVLMNYLQHPLFNGKSRESELWLTVDGVPLSYNGFGDLIRRIKEVSGVAFYTHKLRHTFASQMAAAGVPAYDLKELLGHTDLKTTMIYVHSSPDHLAEVQQSRSPLSRLNKTEALDLRRRGRPRKN